MADLCEITGYTRDQARGLLQEVMPRPGKKSAERIAREFTAQELIVIAAICTLESKLGLRRSHIKLIVNGIGEALSGPRELATDAKLAITFDPPAVSYVSGAGAMTEGIVLALGPIFGRVDHYLGAASAPASRSQSILRFGPAAVERRKR